MSTTQEQRADDLAEPTRTRRPVVARIRRTFLLAAAVCLLYPAFVRASKGMCADSATGGTTGPAPTCVQLELAPSPLFFVGIGLILWFALGRVARTADDAQALRTLDRAALVIGVLTAAGIVIAQVWFALTPLDDLLDGSFTIYSPFPFASITPTP